MFTPPCGCTFPYTKFKFKFKFKLSYKREHRVTVNSHLLKKTFAQHELRKSVLSTETWATLTRA